jgi:hypothetical protein
LTAARLVNLIIKLILSNFTRRHRMKLSKVAFFLVMISLFSFTLWAGVPQLVNFQGQLKNSGGSPLVNDTLAVEFKIYNSDVGGNLKWSETDTVITDANGLFTVILGKKTPIPDSVFADTVRFLGTKVGSDPEISPRSRLTAIGYVYRVSSVDGANGGTISGDLSVTGKGSFGPNNSNSGINAFVAGQFNTASGDWSVVSGGRNNTASAQDATVAGGDGNNAQGIGSFVGGGINNSAPFPYVAISGGNSNLALDTAATIGGGSYNKVSGSYSTVSGGGGPTPADSNSASGDWSVVGGGTRNSASSAHASVSGGYSNLAANGEATVGGGMLNAALGPISTVSGGRNNNSFQTASTVGGGRYNLAHGSYSVVSGGGGPTLADSNSASGDWSVVAGGAKNKATGQSSVVGGGSSNTASDLLATTSGGEFNEASGNHSTIGGGRLNQANGSLATVGGGQANIASNSGAVVSGGGTNKSRGFYSVVSGGGGGLTADSNSASGDWSVIPGGRQNTASGDYSFAAGRRAKATHTGAFVWADSQNTDFTSDTVNTYNIRAENGVVLASNAEASKTIGVGEYFRDNAIVAWGTVTSGSILSQEFGVASFVNDSAGVYTVTIDASSASSTTLVPMAIAEIETPSAPRVININQSATNQFQVFIFNLAGTRVNNDFIFMVTAR